MIEAIFGAISGLFSIVLKIFGWSAEATERKRKEAQAVVNEVLKYENQVDTASDVRVEHDRLNEPLNKAYDQAFGDKPTNK